MTLLPSWETDKPEPFAVDAVLEQIEWEEEKRKNRKIIDSINAQRHEREAKVPWPHWRKKLAAVGLSAFLLALLGLWRILKLAGC